MTVRNVALSLNPKHVVELDYLSFAIFNVTEFFEAQAPIGVVFWHNN
jgi:hypothetical protein